MPVTVNLSETDMWNLRNEIYELLRLPSADLGRADLILSRILRTLDIVVTPKGK